MTHRRTKFSDLIEEKMIKMSEFFIPAFWVIDASGGLRLASEVDKEPDVHWPQNCGQYAATPSSARQNGQKRSRHTSRPVKGVATIISKGP